jgi:hypothetical protein
MAYNNFCVLLKLIPKPSLMAWQKILKAEFGLLSLAYIQAVIPLNVAEGGF